MTLTELRKAERAYRLAADGTDEKRKLRNNLVRVALANGATHQEISDATGLSRGRVGQLAKS